MFDRKSTVLARGHLNRSPGLVLGLMAGMTGTGALPPPRPRAERPQAPQARKVGVGAGYCGTEWVADLLAQARTQDSCDAAGADSLVFPASASIAAAASTTLEVTVQRNGFIGRRLVIPDSQASTWTVDDVRVGGRSIMTSQNSISGEAFSTKAEVCTFLKFPKSGAGIDYSLDITNVSGAAATARGWYIEGASW
jgi:hypothetical protein